jgi:hypothetical protein
MPISFKSLSGSSVIYQPIDTAGTYSLSTTIDAGVYKVTGDSSQTLTFKLKSALGHTFDAIIRGGYGRVYVPVSVTSIIAPAGTYPITLGFEKIAIPQPATPAAIFAWDSSNINNASGKYTFTLPSGASSAKVYWEDGTNELITSGVSVYPKSYVSSSGQTRTGIIVYKTLIGVESIGQSLTTSSSPSVVNFAAITASTNWTAPTGVTSVEFALVAGGGGGGNGGNSAGSGGGGGAGGLIYRNIATAVTPGTSYPVVIGSGGGSNTNGSNSTFLGYTAIGGGAGRYEANGNAGGSGGAAGGYASGTNWVGGAGTSGQGFAGGNHPNDYSRAGGGGSSSAGNTSNAGSGTDVAYFIASGTSTLIAGGGGGGYNNGLAAMAGAAGGGTGGGASAVGGNGTANTGGGAGGGGSNDSAPAGGTGGSGVLYIRYAA